MNDKLKELVKLQGIDIQVIQIEQKLTEIPEEIQKMEEHEKKLEEDFQNAENEMKTLLVSKKEKEKDVQAIDEEIKKHQKELNSLKSNEAYSAVLKEIDGCKQKKVGIENEQIEIMEKEEEFIARKGERRKELDEKKSVYSGKKKELESELVRLKALLADTQAKRAEAAKSVDGDILDKYERIRKNKHGIGIVPIEEESCGGCHMMMTPQEVTNVLRGEDIVICNSCMRIVYFDEKKEEQNQNLQGA